MVDDLDLYAALRRMPKTVRQELIDFLQETGLPGMHDEDLQERLGASADLKRALANRQMS